MGADTCDHDPPACTNSSGSFSCACPEGFEGNGATSTGCLWAAPELSSLGVSAGDLAPPFQRGTLEYTLVLPPHQPEVSFTPVISHPAHGSITVDGILVASGMPSISRRIGVAGETRTLGVTAESGQVRTYHVAMRRSPPTYIKPASPLPSDSLGHRLALSGDARTLAVGSGRETVNVYRRATEAWVFEAELRGERTESGDVFGKSGLAFSFDGSVLAVGAYKEDSSSRGVGGDQTDNQFNASGAVYVFGRSGGAWLQQAFIKASNADAEDRFGLSIGLSSAGDVLAVGAAGEGSAGKAVNNGLEADNSAPYAGAAYVFRATAGVWRQEAYVKPWDTAEGRAFGNAVALSGDGAVLAVSDEQGTVYIFGRTVGSWGQEGVVRAADGEVWDEFGSVLALSENGGVLAAGAPGEDSSGVGVNSGMEANNDADASGAVYVFTRLGSSWTRRAFIKASNADPSDTFGSSIALSAGGQDLLVGAIWESSNASGVNGAEVNNSASRAGAAYLFTDTGSGWTQRAYVKASYPGVEDMFGYSVAISSDGSMLVVGAPNEASPSTGINGPPNGADGPNSGAVYIY